RALASLSRSQWLAGTADGGSRRRGLAAGRRPPAADQMTKRPIMVLGCSSDAGKSFLAAALCRWFARRGERVAPFKAQNMSNNAGVCADGSEIGRAQYLQALAAGVPPEARMNPVLLKPESDTRSQVVVLGRYDSRLSAMPWLERRDRLWPAIAGALDSLLGDFERIVLEGAGSPGEPNLMPGDVVNFAVARHAGAACYLIADIDRGGASAVPLRVEPRRVRPAGARGRRGCGADRGAGRTGGSGRGPSPREQEHGGKPGLPPSQRTRRSDLLAGQSRRPHPGDLRRPADAGQTGPRSPADRGARRRGVGIARRRDDLRRREDDTKDASAFRGLRLDRGVRDPPWPDGRRRSRRDTPGWRPRVSPGQRRRRLPAWPVREHLLSASLPPLARMERRDRRVGPAHPRRSRPGRRPDRRIRLGARSNRSLRQGWGRILITASTFAAARRAASMAAPASIAASCPALSRLETPLLLGSWPALAGRRLLRHAGAHSACCASAAWT